MRKVILFVLTVYTGSMLFGQSNYIIAGQTDSMVYTKYYLPPSFNQQNFQMGCWYGYNIFSMDADFLHNGSLVCNVEASCHHIDPNGNWYGSTIYTGSNCMILCSVNDSIDNGCLYYNYDSIPFARSFLKGDTLSSGAWGQWRSGAILAEAEDFACTYINPPSTQSADSSYFFIKLMNGADTLMGYLCLGSSGFGFLCNYACQGPQSLFVINQINELKDSAHFTISPNPFKLQLDIRDAVPFKYSIYNTSGCLILTGTNSVIETSSFKPGVYLVELQDTFGKFYRKMVKIAE